MITKSHRKQAEQIILNRLGECVRLYGFAQKPSGQSFYFVFDRGKWAFHISFIPHKDDFDLTADIAVRLNAVEEIMNEYDTKITQREKLKNMTIGAEIGNIASGRPIRWTISDLEEIQVVCDGVSKSFETVGYSFLRTHSDLESVHRVLVGTSPSDTILAPLKGPRYMRAIASAVLLRVPGRNIRELVEEFEAKLAEDDDLYLADFRALCQGLYSQESYKV